MTEKHVSRGRINIPTNTIFDAGHGPRLFEFNEIEKHTVRRNRIDLSLVFERRARDYGLMRAREKNGIGTWSSRAQDPVAEYLASKSFGQIEFKKLGDQQ